MTSISFLNEVMTRYPDAISFAPGAPNLLYLEDLDIARYIGLYLEDLTRRRGLTSRQARRLLYEYGPSRGLINDLVAEALERDLRVPVRPEDVVITVGAQEAMFLVLRALHRPGDKLAVVNPSFVGIIGAARLLEIDVVPIDETADGSIDIDQLKAACRTARAAGHRIRALYIAPDFANPSGTVLSPATRRQVLDAAEQEDLFLLEDGAYGFTAAPDADLTTLKAMDDTGRVVYLGTFAKVCLPGARVGFAVADQEIRRPDGSSTLLADELAILKSMVTVNTSPISQAVIGGMLLAHGGSLTALGAEKSALYRRNLARLIDALDRCLVPGPGLPCDLRWNRPAGGFFVRMQLPVAADLALLELCAAEHGVLWTPMAPFYLDDSGANEIRLSCSYLTADQIEEGVGRLAGFLRRLDN